MTSLLSSSSFFSIGVSGDCWLCNIFFCFISSFFLSFFFSPPPPLSPPPLLLLQFSNLNCYCCHYYSQRRFSLVVNWIPNTVATRLPLLLSWIQISVDQTAELRQRVRYGITWLMQITISRTTNKRPNPFWFCNTNCRLTRKHKKIYIVERMNVDYAYSLCPSKDYEANMQKYVFLNKKGGPWVNGYTTLIEKSMKFLREHKVL